MRRGSSTTRLQGAPSILPYTYRSFDLLKSDLTGAVADSIAILWGPTDWIGIFQRISSSAVRLTSTLRLWAADGSEFTIGADGSGSNVERFDGASAPTWGSVGSSTGGLILDGSDAVILPFCGEYACESLTVSAMAIPTLTSEADGQFLGTGSFANSRTKGFLGGVRRTGGAWYRAYSIMTTAPTLTIGGTATAEYAAAVASSDTVLCALQRLACDTTNNRAAYIAGAYRGDEAGTSDNQQSATSSSSAITGSTDHEVVLYAEDAAGDLTVRFTEINVGHLAR